ncbi:uncharacterized protein AB675_5858 [Cyphellophora attinorum]|uniref:Uncharacterized protein n=1 Tax=Cyphellophora attinorum TaxID=1664694 RepID=A0A0N1P0C0_9EURO|nr:uncharacterized protein AB675_5858 [Phialophora attinorum]KPI38883.1 hypothetical protein AB675_5858 [Phialophora attinorum]
MAPGDTVYNPSTGVSFFEDTHDGLWYVDLPREAVRDDVEAALILMHIHSPNVLLWYRLDARPNNTLQIVMRLPNDIAPNVFFPADETVSIAQIIRSMAGRVATTQNQAAARPSTGSSHATIDATNLGPTRSVSRSPSATMDAQTADADEALAPPFTRSPAPSPEIVAEANSPALLSDPRRLSGQLDDHQLACLSNTFAQMRKWEPTVDLITAIIYLEASNWIPSLALQDYHNYLRATKWLRPEAWSARNAFNERVDRMPAQAGHLFARTKLTITIKTSKDGKSTKIYAYDETLHDAFDPFSLRNVLRLNRERFDFLADSLGVRPTNHNGNDQWHPLEKLDITNRYLLRKRSNTPGFPDWKSLAEQHNNAFEEQPLPGWGIVAKQRANVDKDVDRWWLQEHAHKGTEQRHNAGQKDAREAVEKMRREAKERYEERKGQFGDGIEAWEEEWKETYGAGDEHASTDGDEAPKSQGKGKEKERDG